MLTGELPLGKFAPPSQQGEVDVRLDEVVLRTLEKEPERRYQHASEVKTQVENIAATPPRIAGAGATTEVTPEYFRCPACVVIKGPAIGLIATGIFNWLVDSFRVDVGAAKSHPWIGEAALFEVGRHRTRSASPGAVQLHNLRRDQNDAAGSLLGRRGRHDSRHGSDTG